MTSPSSHRNDPALEARLSIRVGSEAQGFTVEAEFHLSRGVLVFFGPSGAGKSLTLQALAGLVPPARGTVRVGGETLFDADRGIDVPAHRRRIGYVPQHQSLFPFLDVRGNVAFGLPRAERRRSSAKVDAALEELSIGHLAHSHSQSLSGGERQRVALARALVVEPRLLALDEPFASIDQEGREELREALRATLDHHGIPAVFVTHDPEEALSLGDRLVRFERGRTVTSGAPAEILRRGQPVVMSGRPAGPPTELDDGRCELLLEGARLVAPRDLLRSSGGNGEVRLEARVRPDRGPNSNRRK